MNNTQPAGRFGSLDELNLFRTQLVEHCGPDAQVRTARGQLRDGAKKPVDKGFLETPLTPEQEREWGTEITKGTGAHFILLLRQSTPNLAVVDLDDMKAAQAKELLELARDARAWCAPSLGKGHHITTTVDAGLLAMVKHDQPRIDLRTKAKGPKYGEVLLSHSTFYAPAPGCNSLAKFSELGNGDLYRLISGRDVTPAELIARLNRELEAEIVSWPDGARNDPMLNLCRDLAMRLRDMGVYEHRDEVFKHLASVWETNIPSGAASWTADHIATRVERSDPGPATASGSRLLQRSAMARVLNRFGGELVRVGKGDKSTMVGWEPILRRWVPYGYMEISDERTAADRGAETFSGLIESAVDAAHADLEGQLVDLSKVSTSVNAIWDSVQRKYGSRRIYREFDNPLPSDTVRYHNLGDGKVLVTRADRASYEAGTAVEIVDNKPEFRALKQTAPLASTASEYFLARAREIVPREEVLEYLRLMWASMLLPLKLRPTNFHVCYGSGSSGKNSLNDAVAGALGQFAVSTEISTFQTTRGGNMDKNKLSERKAMVGADMIVVSESGFGDLDEGVVKTMVTREPILVGALYEDPTLAVITGSITLLTNEYLRLQSTKEDMSRRLRQVPFTEYFKPNAEGERIKQQMKDEAPGILRMMIDDLPRLLTLLHEQGGIPVPDAITEQTAKQLQEAAPIQASLKSFFKVHNYEAGIPLVKQGHMGTGGAVGLTAIASILDAQHGTNKRVPLREAKKYVEAVKACRQEEAHATYRLEPTDVFFDWLAGQTDQTEQQRIDLFYGLFRRPALAEQKYGRKLAAAIADSQRDQQLGQSGQSELEGF